MYLAIGRNLVILLKIDKGLAIYLSLAVSLYMKSSREPLLGRKEVAQ